MSTASLMRALRVVSLLALTQGCRCSALSDEAGGHAFTRCMKADPPSPRKLRVGGHQLSVEERTAELTGPLPLRAAAFTGPVGASLTRAELASVAALKPNVVFVLGGLGDDLEMIGASVAGLSSLGVPVLLVPGGADRLGLIERAIAALAENTRANIVLAAGLDELKIGRQRFVFASGAPDGRYALDEGACGFVQADLDALTERVRGRAGGKPWLVSWATPAGLGLSTIAGAGDVGSAALAETMRTLSARGGLFAWPEGTNQAPRAGDLVALVPRLGRSGALGPEGGRFASGVALLRVSEASVERVSRSTP